MTYYSVATTKDKLSTLIDKALAGEEVIITRYGKPTVEIRVVSGDAKPVKRGWAYYQAKLDRLETIPVNSEKPIMQQIKDEYK
jgi:antitoxin (DNA-binding transcriptional repressor) of toxin-antitoxin stability system